MDYFMWATIILSIWGALGPLAGIWIGRRIAQAWQKKQWLFENKKQEYREVVQALSAALQPIIQCIQPGLLVDEAAIRARGAAENLSYEVLGNRMFIAEELEKLGALDKWVNLVATYEKSRDGTAFTKGYGDLIRQIRAAALKSIELV